MISLNTTKSKDIAFFHASPDDGPQFFTKKLTPIAQLRDSYAVRLQNIQSHYEGRIGVDFVNLVLEAT
jgi:hypothetical protein